MLPLFPVVKHFTLIWYRLLVLASYKNGFERDFQIKLK